MNATLARSGFIPPKPVVTPPPNWVRMRPVDAKELGRRVRAARAYAGLSNTELAEAVGMGRSTLVKTEAGTRQAKTWELWAIAEVCGVPREFFESEALQIGDVEAEAQALEQDEEAAARRSESSDQPSARAENGSGNP